MSSSSSSSSSSSFNVSSSYNYFDSKLPMRDLSAKYARYRNEYFLSHAHAHPPSSSSSVAALGEGRNGRTNLLHSSPPAPHSLSGPLLASSSSSSSTHDDDDTGSGRDSAAAALMRGPTLRPEWADIHDQVEADMRQIKEAISTLKTLHKSRCGVTFNEDAVKSQEEEIEILTQNITTKLRKCENGIKRIALVGDIQGLSVKERNVRLNAMRMLASDLQILSKNFRHAQKDFLHALNEQQGKNSQFGFGAHHSNEEEQLRAAIMDDNNLDSVLTDEQRLQLEEIQQRSNEREKEILRIAKSIHELATLFRELNVLVIEQGTILDRIDYNIERTAESVKKGTAELQKAEDYSKRALSCKCIVILLIIVIILIAILIAKHASSKKSDD